MARGPWPMAHGQAGPPWVCGCRDIDMRMSGHPRDFADVADAALYGARHPRGCRTNVKIFVMCDIRGPYADVADAALYGARHPRGCRTNVKIFVMCDIRGPYADVADAAFCVVRHPRRCRILRRTTSAQMSHYRGRDIRADVAFCENLGAIKKSPLRRRGTPCPRPS